MVDHSNAFIGYSDAALLKAGMNNWKLVRVKVRRDWENMFDQRAEHINMFSFGTFEDDRDGNGPFVNHSGVGL